MSDTVYLSKDGFENLKRELDHLKNVERPQSSQQIAIARDKGDLSENAEYDAAKEAQAFLELKIAKLEVKLSGARILDTTGMDNSKIGILSTVTVKNITVGKEFSYTLVDEDEADVKLKKISTSSPIGRSFLGKKVGEIVDVMTPNGNIQFEILSITR